MVMIDCASVLTAKFTNNTTNVSSTVKFYIDGANSNTYYVTCSSEDECFIHCLSNTSCTNMSLTCNGVCYLNCGDYGDTNGYDCLSNISGTWFPLSSAPTMLQ